MAYMKVEIDFIDNFNAIQEMAHKNAVEKGFYEHGVNDGCLLALIHSEVSEALEVLREPLFSKTALAEELADIIIRTMDFAEYYEIDLASAIIQKMDKNAKREDMHGKRF